MKWSTEETESYEKRAKLNAKAGQELTDAWHKRMRELDERVPKVPKAKSDSKRGCISPLGGKVW
jgi:hypothetical protein